MKHDKICLIGFMGSGKSRMGQLIADELGCAFYDTDKEIEKSEGKSISDLFEEKGESYFRDAESDMLQAILSREEKLVISTGGGAPCSENNIRLLKQHSLVVFLDVSVDDLAQRLHQSATTRPLIEGKTYTELHAFIEKLLDFRKGYYCQAHLRLMMDNRDRSENAGYLLRSIKKYKEVSSC